MKNKFLTKLLCFVISIMMIIPTGTVLVSAGDDIDFELLSGYGAYFDADVDTDAVGYSMHAICQSTYSKQFNNITYKHQLIDMSVPANMASVEANTNAKNNHEEYPDVTYANLGNTDGAWMFKEGTSTSNVTKNALFTTEYITARVDKAWAKCMEGKINFAITDVITAQDKDITFIVEYLDIGTNNIVIKYSNTSFVNGDANGASTLSEAKIERKNSGEWKQAVVQVSDANIGAGIYKTALADSVAQFYISAQRADTYISKLLVVKTEDYEKYLAGELELTDALAVSRAKSALTLDISEAESDFTLPGSEFDGVNVEWSSNNDAIEVDGYNAVVIKGAADIAVTLTATISKGNVSDTRTFTVTVPAKFKKAAGAEIIIGDTPANDVAEGTIAFDGHNTLIKLEEPETGSGESLMYQSSGKADFDTMRVKKADSQDTEKWAVYGTRYYQPSRSRVCNSNIPFNVEEFTPADNKLTFEIEYLDNNTEDITLRYITNGAKQHTTTEMSRTGEGTWKTWKFTLTDAMFQNGAETGLGDSGEADFRIEGSELYISRVKVYMGAYDELKSAAAALTLDEVYDENGISVANGDVEKDFVLPTTIDGVDIDEIIWASADDNIIAIDGSTAEINPSEEKRVNTTLTATIVVGESYVQKSFDITLAKKPKQIVKCSQPEIIGKGTAEAYVEYQITNAGKLIGEDITLILASVDSNSGEIIKITSESMTVEESDFNIYATVDNTIGELKTYLVAQNGAPLYNAAPSPIKNFRVISGTSGINIMWDAAADDYDAIQKYVLYDGAGNIVDELESDVTEYFVPVKAGETKSFAVEGFDHEGLSTGKTEVQSGSLFTPEGITVKLYDLNGEGSNAKMFNDVINDPKSDNHTHKKLMKDSVTGEELECRHTVYVNKNLCSCGLTARDNREAPSYAYFKPDGKYVTKDTKEIAVIVKYFDHGTETVKVQYNTVEDYENNKVAGGSYSFELTGTDTFKTIVIKITNACFFSPDALSNADIRFGGGDNSEFYIAELTMMPLENYAEPATPTLYIAADSIAASYTQAQMAQNGGDVGWGMKLPDYLKDGILVVNKAEAGASTKTFINKGYMDDIVKIATKNDYVLISFGHNDSEADSEGVTVGQYTANMEGFITSIREKGATPVIITSIPQVDLTTGKLVYDKANPDGIMKYRDAALDVADRMDVLSIDLASIMAQKASTMSADQVKALYSNEITHLSDTGAEFVAEIIADAFKDASFGLVSNYIK